MPDSKPSNAPDDRVTKADDLRAAAILSDEDKAPGGGGLLGAGAAEGASAPGHGGTARNAPIDVPTPDTANRDGATEGESVAAAGERAPEPRPTSQ